MKIIIEQKKYEVVTVKTEVQLPETKKYFWHNGIRMAYCVTPVMTTWYVKQYNKPEEIYELEIVLVDPSSRKIELRKVAVSSLPEILKNDKHDLQRIVDNLLNRPTENIRTKEEFEQDFNNVVQEMSNSVTNP